MDELRVLVAAAGRGTRAGLPYPKTLYPVQGKPILVRIVELLAPYDRQPTIIVNPDGQQAIDDCLVAHGCTGHLVVQPEPIGMGDAVLRFDESPASVGASHVLLIWGDIPMISPETVAAVVKDHFEFGNDFTFATRQVESAYTVVSRSPEGHVLGVIETRESGVAQLLPGERDIGLFVFRKHVILDALREDVAGKFGKTTGEQGFLYVIGLLAQRGFKIVALPIASSQDLLSLNSMGDLKGYE